MHFDHGKNKIQIFGMWRWGLKTNVKNILKGIYV